MFYTDVVNFVNFNTLGIGKKSIVSALNFVCIKNQPI